MGLARSIRQAFNHGEKKVKPSWVLDLKSDLLNPPKISTYHNGTQEVILIGTQEGKLYQMEPGGKVMWMFSAQNSLSEEELMFVDSETVNGINTIPLILESRNAHIIIFGTEAGDIFCIDSDGNKLWSVKTNGPIRSQPIVSNFKGKDDRLIVGSGDGSVYIYTLEGKLIEEIPIMSPIENSPLHINNMLILGTRDGEVIAINEESKVLWKFKTEDKITANIINVSLDEDSEECLLIASNDNNLYSLNFEGEVIWTFPTEGSLLSEVVVKDINGDGKKEIIFGSCDNKIYCIDSRGELVWSYETDFWITSTPIVSDIDNDGIIEVIAGSYDHKIYILDSQGDFKLNYIPGLGGVVNQSGHYSNTMNDEVGKNQGKLFCTYSLDGNIVGCTKSSSGAIITNTKQGKIYNVRLDY